MESKQKQSGYRYVIGVDPGSTGAIVVMKDGKIVFKKIMPKVGKDLDYEYLGKFFRHYRKLGATVFLEHVWGRGGKWGATQNFGLGLYYGSIRTAIAMSKIPYVLVTATKWQGYAFQGVSPIYKTGKKKKTKDTKKMALVAVKRLFPSVKMVESNTKQSAPKDGIVDASLICYWGDREIRNG